MKQLDLCCSQVAVIDFETTGLTPKNARIIEVGVALVDNGQVVQRFGQLMNPGVRIPSFVSQLTGIDEEMLEEAPTPEEVMPHLKKVLGQRVILAHNAPFDEKFLRAEMGRVQIEIENPVLCSLRLARRLIHDSKNHRLSTLAEHLNIPVGKAHRALDDAVVTAHLWNHLYGKVVEWTGIQKPAYSLFHMISTQTKVRAQKTIEKLRQESSGDQPTLL